MMMMIGKRSIDQFFFSFFVIHIFITILIDAQTLFPASLYPLPLQNLLSSYVLFSHDHLVRDRPPFFKGLICAEIFFQLPLCFVNAYGFFHRTEWVRTTGLIYGVHTATTLMHGSSDMLVLSNPFSKETMIPILADIIYTNAANAPTLMLIYIPYLLLPLWLVYHLLTVEPYTAERRHTESKKTA